MKKARKKRDDILNKLPSGAGKLIAEKLGCTKNHVSLVLNGRRSDETNLGIQIVKEAEMLAAVNIWKSRFCKFKSLI